MMQSLRAQFRSGSIRWTLGLIAIPLFYLGWLLLAPETPLSVDITSSLVLVCRAAVAALALTPRASAGSLRLRRVWQLFALALVLWVISDVTRWAILVLSGSAAGIPSFGDFFQMAGYLSLFAALAFYPAYEQEYFGRVREGLSISILTVSVAILSWLVFVRPVLILGLAGPAVVFWTAINPIFELILLILLFRLLLLGRSSWENRAFRWISLALTVGAVTDLLWGYLNLLGEFQAGGWVELGWLTSIVFFLPAVLDVRRVVEFVDVPVDRRLRTRSHLLIERLLPIFLAYILVGFVVFDWSLTGQIDPIGIVCSALVTLMVVTRQGVVAGQGEMRQYAALVNASADMAFICETDGKLRFINPAMQQALKLLPEADRTQNLMELVEIGQPLDEILREASASGWSGEVRFNVTGEQSFPALLSLRPVRDERQSLPVLAGTAHNLSEIKQRQSDLQSALATSADIQLRLEELNEVLEERVASRTLELEQMIADLEKVNHELKELDRLKSDFVTLVSHELRAPLTNIRSGVELLMDREPDLNDSARDNLGLIQKEISRLSAFIENILNLSALDAGKLPLNCQSLSIRAVLDEVRERFPEFAEEDQITLSIPEDLPPAWADEQVMVNIFHHLLDNARKYAAGTRVTITAWEADDLVKVSVHDHGPGIPPEERERIFESFHRLDASDSKEIYGHGVGLHIARRYLQEMQGEIRVEDDEIQGAKFTLWVPRGN